MSQNNNDRPPAKVADQRTTKTLSFETQIWQGPIPPPSILEQYERILPGAADRIFTAADEQRAHRFDRERGILTGDQKFKGRGQIFGFVMAMTMIIGGFALILKGKDTGGFIAICAAAVSVIGSFIYDKRHETKSVREITGAKSQPAPGA